MELPWTGLQDKDLEDFIRQEEKAITDVKWSDLSLPLSRFVDEYTMPQIIQIVDGYYSEEDDNSLSSGQIMKVHCLKTITNVCGVDQNGDSILAPLNTPQKVLLRPVNHDHLYETVSDLVRAKPFPKFVEVVRGYYDPTGSSAKSGQDLTIEAGEILEVIRTSENPLLHLINKDKHLVFKNMKGVEIPLPNDSRPGFKPLLCRDACFLAEAVNENALPFYASFVDRKVQYGRNDGRQLSKAGVVKFEEVCQKSFIIASCGLWSVRVVFTIPKDIDVTVRVAEGTLTRDPSYAGLCQGYNNYRKIDDLVVKRYELDIHRNLKEIKGYEYHIKTASEGEFIGLPIQNDKDYKESDENEGSDDYLFFERNTDNASTNHVVNQGEITNLESLGSREDHVSINQSSSTYENSTQGSYNFLTGTAMHQGDDEKVKLIGMKKLAISTERLRDAENREKSNHDVAESNSPAKNQILMQNKQPIQQQSNAKAVPEITSTDTSREMGNPSPTLAPFQPQPNPKKFSPGPKPYQSIKSNLTEMKTNNIDVMPKSSDFKIPTDLSSLDTKSVCACLKILNLNHLVDIFDSNQINGSLLVSLDDEDFKDLNVGRFERKKLMRFIEGWRPDDY